MKKIVIYTGFLTLIFLVMSFTFVHRPGKKKVSHATASQKVFDCSTPTGVSVTSSGGTTTVSFTSTGLPHTVGGYYHCLQGNNRYDFSFCLDATTNSVSFPTSCGGTVQVVQVCTGTCSSPGTSSLPAGPYNF